MAPLVAKVRAGDPLITGPLTETEPDTLVAVAAVWIVVSVSVLLLTDWMSKVLPSLEVPVPVMVMIWPAWKPSEAQLFRPTG